MTIIHIVYAISLDIIYIYNTGMKYPKVCVLVNEESQKVFPLVLGTGKKEDVPLLKSPMLLILL